MATMNVSIPDELKSFVETQVSNEGYSTSSEYVRELIRRDRQRSHLRGLILEGLTEGTTLPVDADFWATRRVGRPSR
jgi:antitoxin ParD1/3/4